MSNLGKHACWAEFATLVFPANHPDGMKYIETADERGESIIQATSESYLATSAENNFVFLPYVHESTFGDQFLQLINTFHITRVYSPVAAVYSWLEPFIRNNHLELHLIGKSPIKKEVTSYRKLMAQVASYRSFMDDCADGKCDLSDLEIAAVFRMADHIYGESNTQKIAAMMAIFSSAPKGDVIEIGSLAGKSSSVLAMMARRYKTGNVLAIDPWQPDAATQQDSPETIRIHTVEEWDYEMLPKNFLINMMPSGLGHFNYLQQKSEDSIQFYKKNNLVQTNEFGEINYQGRISVIHIDGNHDYEQVKLDCDLWLPLLANNAWLILDDYVWIHGDGPRRVGDALLNIYRNKIDRSFVCGKALFIKFFYFS